MAYLNWILGVLCKTYGIGDVQTFAQGTDHILIECQYPGVKGKYGYGIYIKCARTTAAGLVGKVRAIVDGPQNGNQSVFYQAIATRGETQPHHHMTCKLITL